MFRGLRNLGRLYAIARTLARHDALFPFATLGAQRTLAVDRTHGPVTVAAGQGADASFDRPVDVAARREDTNTGAFANPALSLQAKLRAFRAR